MQVLLSSIESFFRVFRLISISSILDILIIAFFIYEAIRFIRMTRLSQVAVGLLVLILALWISDVAGLLVVNFILRKAVELGLLALVVLFQPELRRALEKVGSGRLTSFLVREKNMTGTEQAITQTVLACSDMSRSRTGALIIFERDNKLTDPINTGTIIDSATTSELLKNLFYNKAPLHDGAVIIRDGRIAAAGCMLPLSGNTNLSRDLGMRHRAGIGMSERSDAVVVIVSEETGAISVAVEGMLKRHLSPETCQRLLRNELLSTQETETKTGGPVRFFARWKKGKDNVNVEEDHR
jgi:diadenylate cyclase